MRATHASQIHTRLTQRAKFIRVFKYARDRINADATEVYKLRCTMINAYDLSPIHIYIYIYNLHLCVANKTLIEAYYSQE